MSAQRWFWLAIAVIGFVGTAMPREAGVLSISVACLAIGAYHFGSQR